MRILWGGWRGLEGLGSAAMAGHGGGELGSGGEGDAVREFERGRGQTARGLTGERGRRRGDESDALNLNKEPEDSKHNTIRDTIKTNKNKNKFCLNPLISPGFSPRPPTIGKILPDSLVSHDSN